MAVVWAHCKTKMLCEPDEPKEEGDGGENGVGDESKKGHGGCGHVQPLIRKEALKLFVQYKRPKDEDEVSPFLCVGYLFIDGSIYRR
jgi:DNA-directed RNA polymerase II subunit RPB1